MDIWRRMGFADGFTAPFKFGTEADYSQFEADGTLVFKGDATTHDDINLSLVPPISGPSAPNVIALNGSAYTKVYSFTGTGPQVDQLSSSCEILHSYKEGSDIVPHIHWSPTTADVGNVKFQLEYTWVNRFGVFSHTLVSVTASTSGVAWREERTNLPTISGAGMQIGSRFIFTLLRDPADPADTYAHDVAIHDFGIHFEKDTTGSRGVTAK